ncbi:heptaprenyl diphosphate synthase [Caloramator quimbayensis]|uniref:Heptaprenyl diphosphate synthase n=1 Tax=Caloramator quimbayensis TaxID=1147123 RepID=A0A1T4XE89_9CLOT|nr:Gx transporter family protein [Caloramator quimbayensis]SKA87846.1 heptaprenyl diphosphate synthase [Caloramator quimbayensis]
MKKTQNMIFISILVAQALVLYIVETMIPVPFITPGAKLGLANIITVVSLYSLSLADTFLVVILRIILSTLLVGSLSSFFFSLSGGILSLLVMFILKKFGKENVSIIGVSVMGSVFHNIGQILVASITVQNIRIIAYLPVLMIAGIGTGIFVGITSKFLLVHLKKLQFTKIN